MKYPLLPIFLFFLFAITLCTTVLFFTVETPKISRAENQGDNRGRVLGASERIELPAIPAPVFNNSLPINPETGAERPKKKDGYAEPQLPACSSIVVDSASGKILGGKDYEKRRPIASITKLAAALVILDSSPEWKRTVRIESGDIVQGGRVYAGRGEELSMYDLLRLGLVASDNTAIMALARAVGSSTAEFVRMMNSKAQALGLSKTVFADPVGIEDGNISTALEAAKMARIALDEPLIREALLVKNLTVKTKAGRAFTVRSTDSLLGIFPQNGIELLGGKTGHTNAAGYCFVGLFSDAAGNEIVSAVLGEDNIRGRFTETQRMIDWAYANYEW